MLIAMHAAAQTDWKNKIILDEAYRYGSTFYQK